MSGRLEGQRPGDVVRQGVPGGDGLRFLEPSHQEPRQAGIEATTTGKHIGRQLTRCSSSPGASYEEARSAESLADFIHKLGIAAKEMRETVWWLRLIDRARLAPQEDLAHWIDEANQLLSILIAPARIARGRVPQREALRLRAAPRIE